jgi:hypothetical protein
MARSGGVTVSAVVVLIGSALTILGCTVKSAIYRRAEEHGDDSVEFAVGSCDGRPKCQAGEHNNHRMVSADWFRVHAARSFVQ